MNEQRGEWRPFYGLSTQIIIYTRVLVIIVPAKSIRGLDISSIQFLNHLHTEAIDSPTIYPHDKSFSCATWCLHLTVWLTRSSRLLEVNFCLDIPFHPWMVLGASGTNVWIINSVYCFLSPPIAVLTSNYGHSSSFCGSIKGAKRSCPGSNRDCQNQNLEW